MKKLLAVSLLLAVVGGTQARADDSLVLKITELQKAVEELTDLNLAMAENLRKANKKIERLEEQVADLKAQIKALKKKPAYSYRYRHKQLEGRGYTLANKTKVLLDNPISTSPAQTQVVIRLPDTDNSVKEKAQIVVATYLHYDKTRLSKIWQNLAPLVKRYPVKAYISPRKKYLVVFVEASPKERATLKRFGFRDAFVSKTKLLGKEITSLEDLKELVSSAEQTGKVATG